MSVILKLRERLGLSQRQFGAAAKYNQNSVSRWERGVSVPLDAIVNVRAWCLARGIEWQDAWIFPTPPERTTDAKRQESDRRTEGHAPRAEDHDDRT